MGLERKARQGAPDPRGDGSARATESEARNLRSVEYAKVLSFRGMAASLGRDLGLAELDSKPRVLNGVLGDRALAPLACEVAVDYLNALGLGGLVTLQLDRQEKIMGEVSPGLRSQLTPKDIDERKAVVSYTWERDVSVESIKSAVSAKLRRFEREAAAAQTAFIKDYLGFSERVSRKYRNRGVSDADVVSEAYLVLTTTIDRFDWRLGYPFIGFFKPVLEGSMKRLLRDKSHMVRPPRTIHDKYAAVEAAESRVLGARGKLDPTTIAQEAGLTTDEVIDVLVYRESRTTSINQLLGKLEGNPIELGATLPGAEDTIESALFNLAVDAVMARLSDRDKEVFIRRMLGQDQKTIGDAVSVSQMHVSRLLKGIGEMIRAELTETEVAPVTKPNQLVSLSLPQLERIFKFPNLSERDQAIARMLHSGMTYEAIGGRLGLSSDAVRMIEGFILSIHSDNQEKRTGRRSVR